MKPQIKNILVFVLIVIAIGTFFWVANFLGSGEKAQSEKPIVICKPQNAPPEKQECFWTAHIHAMVRVFKGGTEIPLGFEQGKLEGAHTHSEQNKIHWHGLIPVDPKVKEVRDWSLLQVGRIPESLNLTPQGTPRFIVNGKAVEPSYLWQDGDTIEIHYE